MNLTIEEMREIVDGAPSTATHFNQNSLGGHYAKEVLRKREFQWAWFNTIDGVWYYDFAEHNHVSLSDLKAQIDHHYYGRSEAEELAAYAELSQEKIEGGAMLVGDFGEARKKIQSVLDDDRTDHVSDIRNHIAPTTVSIERGEHE